MDTRRVGLTTALALAAVALAGSIASAVAGGHVHGAAGLGWDLTVFLPFLAISAYAYLTRTDHPTAQRLAILGSLFTLTSAVGPPVGFVPTTIPSDVLTLGREQLWTAYLGQQLLTMGYSIAAARLFGLYPDGRVETATERWLLRPLWVVLTLPLIVLVSHERLVLPSYYDVVPTEPSPFFIAALAPVGEVAVELMRTAEALPLVGLGLLIARYRRSGSERRWRMRWLLLPIGVAALVPVIQDSWTALVPGRIFDDASLLPIPAVPLAVVLGLRDRGVHRLRTLLRRSLVYGVLWLLIAGIYIGIAVVLGLAVSEQFPVLAAILLTIAVTLAFQPARRWLERVADRWVFGARLGRYEALTRLGQLLEEAFDLEELLPHLARTIRAALGLTWVRVELAGDTAAAVVDGEPGERQPVLSVPIELGGERLGVLECGHRRRGVLGDADRAALEDLGRQAALAIRNVRLAAQLADRVEELAESRTRLVQAQEAERRRIERDLHDGIQQDLVALIGEVGRARTRLDGAGPVAAPLLDELQVELTRVLRELRELAHGIHPQVLTDRGLLAAIEARARRSPIDVEVRVAATLRTTRFPEEVEGALYFTVCEALANILKHAHARRAGIRLDQRDGVLVVDVTDDGCGIEAGDGAAGTGLSNLAERLAALDGRLTVGPANGGGTRVRAEVPVGDGAAHG